jgi:hypothetical protein
MALLCQPIWTRESTLADRTGFVSKIARAPERALLGKGA